MTQQQHQDSDDSTANEMHSDRDECTDAEAYIGNEIRSEVEGETVTTTVECPVCERTYQFVYDEVDDGIWDTEQSEYRPVSELNIPDEWDEDALYFDGSVASLPNADDDRFELIFDLEGLFDPETSEYVWTN